MKRTLAMLLAVLAVAVFALPTAVAQKVDQADVQLKTAIKKEVVDGDLKAAIELYRKIAQGGDRAVAARALVRMGQCYEKLGDAESAKAYQRVLSEFADQKEAVEEARALLAAGGRDRQRATGVSEQQVWVLHREGPSPVPSAPSADGRSIPFTSLIQFSLRDVARAESRTVVESEKGYRITSGVISPDGRQIAYTRATLPPLAATNSELRIADSDGSRTKVLASEKDKSLFALGWSPSGGHVLIGAVSRASAERSLALVSAADGSVRALTTGDEYSNGCFSPDGKYIVTYRLGASGGVATSPPGGLMLRPTDGSRATALFESQARNWWPSWSPDGQYILFLSDRSGATGLWSIRVSNGRAAGEPEQVKRNVGSMRPLGFTRDGAFYYTITSDAQSNVYAADLDPATGRALSKAERVNQRFVGNAGLAAEWSPDGQLLAYTGSSQETGGAAYTTVAFVVRSERTGEERTVAPVPPFERGTSVAELQWFADGGSLLAQAVGGINNSRSFFCRVDVRTGEAKALLDLGASGEGVYYPALSHDGRTLFYVQTGSTDKADHVMRRDLASGETRELYRAGWIEHLLVSADGRELLFEGSYQDQNTMSVLMLPADGGVPRELHRSKSYIEDHAWSRDGQRVWIVPISKTSAELFSLPVAGGEPQSSGLTGEAMYSLSLRPDGRRVAFTRGRGAREEVWVARNLLSVPKTPRR